MIDLDALDASIADGERRNLFVAPLVKDLIAELREARGERAAVVAWLRSQAETTNYRPRGCPLADAIERGDHMKGNKR